MYRAGNSTLLRMYHQLHLSQWHCKQSRVGKACMTLHPGRWWLDCSGLEDTQPRLLHYPLGSNGPLGMGWHHSLPLVCYRLKLSTCPLDKQACYWTLCLLDSNSQLHTDATSKLQLHVHNSNPAQKA